MWIKHGASQCTARNAHKQHKTREHNSRVAKDLPKLTN